MPLWLLYIRCMQSLGVLPTRTISQLEIRHHLQNKQCLFLDVTIWSKPDKETTADNTSSYVKHSLKSD